MSVGIFGQCLYSGPHLSGLPYLGRLDPAFALQVVIQYQDRPLGTCGGTGADFTRSSSFIIPWMFHVHIPAVWQLTATLYHTAELRVSHWHRLHWSGEECNNNSNNNNNGLITVFGGLHDLFDTHINSQYFCAQFYVFACPNILPSTICLVLR